MDGEWRLGQTPHGDNAAIGEVSRREREGELGHGRRVMPARVDRATVRSTDACADGRQHGVSPSLEQICTVRRFCQRKSVLWTIIGTLKAKQRPVDDGASCVSLARPPLHPR